MAALTVTHHGHLLGKEELLKLVWPDAFVEEANLSYNISLIRKALCGGENRQKFIETIPKRGYRFVASVKEVKAESVAPIVASEVDQALGAPGGYRSSRQLHRRVKPSVERHTVGRERERAELRSGFESTLTGGGLMLCVAGEPGIGKTTLVEDFLAELAAEDQCTVARGRCSERLAGTEAYLPLLEVLESLLQSGSNPAAARVMKQIAPTWYAQLVPLAGDDEETARLMNEVKSASQERLKRELGAFLQEVSRLRPLLLFFDDLHWADVSTIDMLSFLGCKFEALGVLIVITYRPSDLLLQKHPFLQIKPDLQARGVCHELALQFLNQAEIGQYLELEFPGHAFPPELPKLIHLKTEGSPLFMADLVRYLCDRGVIAHNGRHWTLAQALPEIERELPESVRGMIERKVAQLGEEDRRLLMAASVQGYEFDSAVIAQVLNIKTDEVEERLDKLERVYAFVRLVSEKEFPNRTLTLRYRFVHVLYQNALYGSLRATRKVTLSRDVVQALEGYYGEKRAGVENELAVLCEAAREYARAADYFQLAAQQASQVFATQEAVSLARRGLAMVDMLPDSRERREQEFSLQVVLGNALIATKGNAATEVEQTYSRAHELAQQLGEMPHLLPALWGLCAVNIVKGQPRKALEYGEKFLRLAERLQDPAVLVGHHAVGVPLYFLGKLSQARDHLQRSACLYTAAQHRFLTWLYGHDPGMVAEKYVSWTLWLLGYPEQALAHGLESLRIGMEVSHANTQAHALTGTAITYQHCGDRQRVRELAEDAVTFSAEQGLPLWLGLSMALRGWAMVGQGEAAEGIEELRRGIEASRATGAELYTSYLLCLLAEAYGIEGQPRQYLAELERAQAITEDGDGRYWEAEIARVKGELLLKDGAAAAEAEQCFRRAIEIARHQQAKSLELRAVMSFARLQKKQCKLEEARQMLAEVYGWFTEGFDMPDLKDAKALLEDLESGFC
ncbi:MAG: AAA family ATPase [Acidobacteriota bacterium]|nr:AAA family ATPase [Acidobacteriota bacterium]